MSNVDPASPSNDGNVVSGSIAPVSSRPPAPALTEQVISMLVDVLEKHELYIPWPLSSREELLPLIRMLTTLVYPNGMYGFLKPPASDTDAGDQAKADTVSAA